MEKQWKQWKHWQSLFLGAPELLQMVLKPWNKKTFAPWKKSYDQPRQHVKSRDIILPTKVRLVKAMVFPVVMYVCQSWTIKKAEHWRTDSFELFWWRRLLGVSWIVRRSNYSILKEISPEYSLEVLMLTLQYFGHLMRRTYSWKRPRCWERLKAGGEGVDRGWDGWMALPTWWSLSKLQKLVMDREA